jgi:hypothetical protein
MNEKKPVIPEQITQAIGEYLKEHPELKENPDSIKRMTANSRSFQELISFNRYKMEVEITDEYSCVVQFSSDEGKIYTTYIFNKVVIPV